MEPQESKRNSASNEQTKKVYQKPQLEVYGDLGEITQKINKHGHGDGGTNPGGNNRTQ